MRVQTSVPLGNWSAVGPAAREAETLGYDGLMFPEVAHDPFIPVALAALATERIELGTAIVVAFPRSPMVVANTAWDLQVHSRGRFVLGLGSQVKGHNERRFSVPWSAPAPRLAEYVEALRAIWHCWEKGEALRFEGEHYRFTLMTPEFSPPPSGLPRVPVHIAAVGAAMLRTAGRVCDGVRLHGFCTRRYLEEVALPALDQGRARSGRRREDFEIWGGGFIATGRDADELQRSMDETRTRIAFYGSTRSYRPVLSLHGWDDLGDQLHRLSVEGRWGHMPGLVPDDVVHAFTACATYESLATSIEKRFGGLSDTIALAFPRGTPDGLVREILTDVKGIPAAFEG